MAHARLIVGESIKINRLLVDYIDRVYVEHFEELDEQYFLSKKDNNLFLFLEEVVEKNQFITIFCSSESFNLIGKLLCTITDDAQVLQDGILAPSKTLHLDKSSYLLEFNQKHIEVVLVNQNISELRSPFSQTKVDFSLIDMDEESCRILLEPLTQTFDISLEISTLIQGWVLVEARAQKYGQMENFLKSVASLFADKILSSHDPIEYIVKNLARVGKKITFVESCTGGLLCSMFTCVSGASNVIDGSVVSYANKVKSGWLKVEDETLQRVGAVSEKCAVEMAKSGLKLANADICLSVTGIAGPNGGSEDKPVGTVYIAIAKKDGGALSERLNLSGDRKYIQLQSAYHAIKLLLEAHREIFF